VTAAGATVTKAGSTVTVSAATVTVTASGANPTGAATLEDVLGWFRAEVKKVVDEGSAVTRRRHARAIAF
jgi:hypothetical protein